MFYPASKVLILTPGALLIGVVTHTTTTATVRGADTRFHVVHWDNVVGGEASITVTENELTEYRCWDTSVGHWLAGKGAVANRYADETIEKLNAMIPRDHIAVASEVAA
tara:strand:+ start:1833 stop:2159 length:327 start_codon:yes stop_codon:yes gene_type:complete